MNRLPQQTDGRNEQMNVRYKQTVEQWKDRWKDSISRLKGILVDERATTEDGWAK
jgi:hypothetical protein